MFSATLGSARIILSECTCMHSNNRHNIPSEWVDLVSVEDAVLYVPSIVYFVKQERMQLAMVFQFYSNSELVILILIRNSYSLEVGYWAKLLSMLNYYA